MKKRVVATASLVALALTNLAGNVSAQEPGDPADEAATTKSATGTIVEIEDADGRTGYFLRLEDGTLVELSFGPSWFWGPLNPLHDLAMLGEEVTVDVQLRDGEPNENASDTAKERAAEDPALKVRSVEGSKLRVKGKPPWAGGPKVVGEVHPGYASWSKSQAKKAAQPEQATRPDKPGKPDNPGRP